MTAAPGAGGAGAESPAQTPWRRPAPERVKVHEIFHSIQGESTWAGLPCVLVRLTGCQMRCTWCDTPYAFYDGTWRSLDEVLAEVETFGCPMVELTGGEPLLQPGALPLLTALCDRGYRVLLETGGGLDISKVDPRVHRIVDVKCPASGEAAANHWPNLGLLTPRDEVKLVVANRSDYEWARDVIREHRLVERCPVLVSPVHGSVAAQDLARWLLEDGLQVRLQVQLHKLLWGAETRGV